MCPITHTTFLALGTAIVASFVFGFIWYGPLFGKTWANWMGFKTDGCCGKPPMSSLLLSLLGSVFTVFVMAYIVNVFKPWCHVGVALLVWLGFYLPALFGSVAWEGRPWKLFVLNAAYAMLNLQLISTIVLWGRV